MIHLNTNEKILMVLHRHWIVIFGKFLLGFILLMLPLPLAALLLKIPAGMEIISVIFAFVFVLYLMVVTLMVFIFWFDYHLDSWIITNERIIDIQQKGLFNRAVSEFALDKVQDVTIEIPDMLSTLLSYGNIIIQTAGETTFRIEQVPDLYTAKNLILDNSLKDNPINPKQNVGT